MNVQEDGYAIEFVTSHGSVDSNVEVRTDGHHAMSLTAEHLASVIVDAMSALKVAKPAVYDSLLAQAVQVACASNRIE